MLTSFRFWGSERGSDKFGPHSHPMQASVALHKPILHNNSTFTSPASSPVRPPKRQRDSVDDFSPCHEPSDMSPPAKRAKVVAPAESPAPVAIASPPETEADMSIESPPPSATTSDDAEQARDAIHYQFGLEILLKHDELRLINQELAKCQVALEQLRRCHLIPYPVSCPTPEQMMEISSGKGPAVQNRAGEAVPQWAPPFGVVDGPYARHYAKWLIPDPKFDGMQSEWQPVMETGRSRTSAEGRATRNSVVDLGAAAKPRRVTAGQKLQSLSSGYPQPKDKAGPCVLKRSDGQTVKLVCLDCQRENFSSTQGFINHCRIAHRRDFKSHEEAAMQSGHPFTVDDSAPVVPEVKEKKEEKAPSTAATAPTGLVHPFANAHITDKQAYTNLQSRITSSLKLYHQGKLPGVTSIPTSAPESERTKADDQDPADFVSESSTPFLSKLMRKRKFQGNLSDIVRDAKQKIALDDLFTPGDDYEDSESTNGSLDSSKPPASRAPVVMRVPARVAMSPAPQALSTRPTSSKGMSPNTGFASPPLSLSDKDERRVSLLRDGEVDMDADLSPNTLVSNNAPSLVSDDGEYDDSDDGSSVTDASDAIEAESVSDVAEISIDEDHVARPLRHRTGNGMGSGMHMKDESKHVTLINPVKNNAKRARRV